MEIPYNEINSQEGFVQQWTTYDWYHDDDDDMTHIAI